MTVRDQFSFFRLAALRNRNRDKSLFSCAEGQPMQSYIDRKVSFEKVPQFRQIKLFLNISFDAGDTYNMQVQRRT
ncbi:hypothetical protein DesyoDRAFT_1891 [Desulfosporosinus youngiae DSM 17734]|uniref:Uncharacterized protein n=1 Tax=Desulfosporosinus youngiae DSM 17734 TaxID=768710 RepID=H5XUI8_9FIRM|nr:hypothetical protein DesyoDRAFT_1891 [Desulfosporosinus youngiae DSM 17734]